MCSCCGACRRRRPELNPPTPSGPRLEASLPRTLRPCRASATTCPPLMCRKWCPARTLWQASGLPPASGRRQPPAQTRRPLPACAHRPSPLPRHTCLAAGPAGRRGDMCSAVVLMQAGDLARMAPGWLHYSEVGGWAGGRVGGRVRCWGRMEEGVQRCCCEGAGTQGGTAHARPRARPHLHCRLQQPPARPPAPHLPPTRQMVRDDPLAFNETGDEYAKAYGQRAWISEMCEGWGRRRAGAPRGQAGGPGRRGAEPGGGEAPPPRRRLLHPPSPPGLPLLQTATRLAPAPRTCGTAWTTAPCEAPPPGWQGPALLPMGAPASASRLGQRSPACRLQPPSPPCQPLQPPGAALHAPGCTPATSR